MTKKDKAGTDIIETTVMPEPGQAIVTQESKQRALAETPTRALTPMEMLSVATQQGAAPETIEKYMDLQERFQANEARAAYSQAFVMFKAKCPTIRRSGTGHYGAYATLRDIDEQIRPLLEQCQLAYNWATVEDTNDWIKVECRIRHVMGHSEATPFSGPPDRDGRRNELMARASTMSYLQRYTLKTLLGIVDGDFKDDDGSGGAASTERQTKTKDLPVDETAYKRFAEVVQTIIGAAEPPTKTFIRDICGQAMYQCGSKDLAVVTTWLAEKGQIDNGTVTVRGQAGDEEVATDGKEAEPAQEFEWLCTNCELGFNGEFCEECGKSIDREPWINHVFKD